MTVTDSARTQDMNDAATGADGSVTVTDLRKTYDRSPGKDSAYAVDGVSFDIPRGSFLTLLGPSGCGKTTTLRCVAGLEQASSGRITMGGQVVFDSTTKRAVRTEDRPIAMVPQSYGIWPHMTVLDNASFPLRHGRNRQRGKDARKRALEVLEQVGLAPMADRWATQLSGGQQQRLAFARALLGDPEVLLLDEPLSNLDANLREEMRFEIRRLHDAFQITTIYVTHDQAEAMVTSDRIAVMNTGRIEQVGTPEEVYERPATAFVAGFIGRANLLRGKVVGDGVVECEGGVRLLTTAGPEHRRGEEVAVSIRPHRIALSPDRGATPGDGAMAGGRVNLFRGTVTRAIYFGDAMDYQVALTGADCTLRVAGGPDKRFSVGQAVAVRVEAEHCVLVH